MSAITNDPKPPIIQIYMALIITIVMVRNNAIRNVNIAIPFRRLLSFIKETVKIAKNMDDLINIKAVHIEVSSSRLYP
jgi:hypothetical protein